MDDDPLLGAYADFDGSAGAQETATPPMTAREARAAFDAAHASDGFAGMEAARDAMSRMGLSADALREVSDAYTDAMREHTRLINDANAALQRRQRLAMHGGDGTAEPDRADMVQAALSMSKDVADIRDMLEERFLEQMEREGRRDEREAARRRDEAHVRRAMQDTPARPAPTVSVPRQPQKPRPARTHAPGGRGGGSLMDTVLSNFGLSRIGSVLSTYSSAAGRVEAAGRSVQGLGEALKDGGLPSLLAAFAASLGLSGELPGYATVSRDANASRTPTVASRSTADARNGRYTGVTGGAAGDMVDAALSLASDTSPDGTRAMRPAVESGSQRAAREGAQAAEESKAIENAKAMTKQALADALAANRTVDPDKVISGIDFPTIPGRSPEASTLVQRMAVRDMDEVAALRDAQPKGIVAKALEFGKGNADAGGLKGMAASAATKAGTFVSSVSQNAALGGTSGGVLGALGGVVRGAAPALGLAAGAATLFKTAMQSTFDANRLGAIQGDGVGEGYRQMGQNAWQDAASFLGLSNVSGSDLNQFRSTASKLGFNLQTGAGQASIAVQRHAKETGLDPAVAARFTHSMLMSGASADEASAALDGLRDAARGAGVDFEDFAKTVQGVKDVMAGVSSGEDANAKATAITSDTVAAVNRAMGTDMTSEGVLQLINNPTTSNLVMTKAMELGLPKAYAGDMGLTLDWLASNGLVEDAMGALNEWQGTIVGSSSDALMQNRLRKWFGDETGLNAYTQDVAKAQKAAEENVREAGGSYTAPVSTATGTTSIGGQKVEVHLVVDAAPGFAQHLTFAQKTNDALVGSRDPLNVNNPLIGRN